MDWTAVRLFSLGIGGAFVMGSVIATAYHVGGAEPIFLADDPDGHARSAWSQPGVEPPGGAAYADDAASADPTAPPPGEPRPLQRTPAVTVPTASEAGGSGRGGGAGSPARGGSSSDGGGGGGGGDGADPDGGDDGDAFPFLHDPAANADGNPAEDVAGAAWRAPTPPDASQVPGAPTPSAMVKPPVKAPTVALPDEDDVTEPALDVKANVPSAERLLPGLRFPAMAGLADALLRAV